MFVSLGLSLVLAAAPVLAGAAATPDAAIAEAIVRAVRLRLGDTVTVVVSSLHGVRLSSAASAPVPAGTSTFIAAPEPAARLGAPVRFRLSAAQPGRPAVRVGEAVAVLHVTAPIVETLRAVARGERLLEADLRVTTVIIERAPLRPLLSMADTLGARATRDISEGTMLTRADVAPEPLVRSGDIVRASARTGGVEIVGDMVAAESGSTGDVIRVVNQETKHAVRARVVARGEVEVVSVR